jgi:type III secretory pathway component EscU
MTEATETTEMISASAWQNHWEQAVEYCTERLRQHLLHFNVPEGTTVEAVTADFHVLIYGHLTANQKIKEALEAAGGEITKEALMEILATQAVLFETPVPSWVELVGKTTQAVSRRTLQHML